MAALIRLDNVHKRYAMGEVEVHALRGTPQDPEWHPEGDVWIHDSDRDKLTRVTFHNSAIGPIWTSDGTRVTYGLTAGGMEGIGWKSADGAGVEQLIARESGEFAAIPEAWLPEERTLLYSRFGGKGGSDIMALDVGSGEGGQDGREAACAHSTAAPSGSSSGAAMRSKVMSSPSKATRMVSPGP